MAVRFTYSDEQVAFLKEQYKEHRISALTQLFNDRFGLKKTRCCIKSVLNNRGIVCGRAGGFLKGERPGIFSEEQAKFIKKQYVKLMVSELATATNTRFGTKFTAGQIKTFVRRRGILSGRTGNFTKGIIPWNAGTKGVVKPNSGNFKKGNMPVNEKPMGHERADKDGCVWIKVRQRNPHTGAPTRYLQKHRYLWEQEHGPIPKSRALLFIDSDKANCDLDNLVMVSRAELLHLNQHNYHRLPTPELRETMRAIARLECASFAKMRS